MHFMDLKVSLPCAQQPTTSPYPEPDESIPQFPTYFPKIHSNIILIFCNIRV